MGLSDIGDQVRQLLSTAGRSLNTSEPGAALVSRITVVLMVFDNRLYQLGNGRWANLSDDHNDSRQERAEAGTTAVRIARAAATLLADADDGSRKDPHNVLLLLPPADFLVTPVKLPGVAPAAVRPALQLQADSLLPGFDEPLSPAVKTTADQGDVGNTEPHMAFWLPTADIDTLFDAFAAESLFLTAVMPRPALISAQHDEIVVDDQDGDNLSVIQARDGVVRQCLQTRLIDLDTPAFDEQWQAETTALMASAPTRVTLRSAEDYLDQIRQHGGDVVRQAGSSYAICPAAALAARHQFDKGKRLWLGAAVLAALMLVGTLPFIVQAIQLRSLTNTLAEQEALAAPARADQLAVRDFESRWGVLTEYPQQDVPAMLLALQAVISPSVLTFLELEEGYISIEGESEDPQALLQQLEQNDMFTEVDFARATSNNRYYIDLRLTTVNFPAYHEWYFPESQ
ncbi:MAG: hypothetical protein WD600_01345 [Pseudohongiella sp.]